MDVLTAIKTRQSIRKFTSRPVEDDMVTAMLCCGLYAPTAKNWFAFDCSYPCLSKPNTVWTIRMHTNKGKVEIAKEAFAKIKGFYLYPPVGFIG